MHRRCCWQYGIEKSRRSVLAYLANSPRKWSGLQNILLHRPAFFEILAKAGAEVLGGAIVGGALRPLPAGVEQLGRYAGRLRRNQNLEHRMWFHRHIVQLAFDRR